MALSEENGVGTTMLVQPTAGYANGGFGGFGNDWGWIIHVKGDIHPCGG